MNCLLGNFGEEEYFVMQIRSAVGAYTAIKRSGSKAYEYFTIDEMSDFIDLGHKNSIDVLDEEFKYIEYYIIAYKKYLKLKMFA